MSKPISQFTTSSNINSSCDYIPFVRSTGTGWDADNYKILVSDFMNGVSGSVTQLCSGSGINVSPSSGTGTVTVSNTGVLQILTGSNITISPSNGLGIVTISSVGGTGGSGGLYTTGSSTTSTQRINSNNFANAPWSVVLGGCTNVTNGQCSGILGGHDNSNSSFSDSFIIGSNLTATASCTTFVNNLNVCGNEYVSGNLYATSSWATNALTSSYLIPGTYDITSSWALSASQAISSSYATSASYAKSASYSAYASTSSYLSSSVPSVKATIRFTTPNICGSLYNISNISALGSTYTVCFSTPMSSTDYMVLSTIADCSAGTTLTTTNRHSGCVILVYSCADLSEKYITIIGT